MSKAKNQKKTSNHATTAPSKATSQATAKTTTQPKPAKQRNMLLTIALVLVILHGILVLALFWFGAPGLYTVGSIALWLTILAAIGDIVAAVGMWLWKQWGIYLYAVATIAGAVGALLATGSMLFLFGALLPAIIVLYIVAMQRNKFE